ncbi:C1-like protein [Artemisia annua]|uniref:C1-like protein n=1 Tax=Artemisia annua TaxID=35608 RepID=A0A2U1LI85_ARTAN|nr:C1-like protein [Artemisia annua]
MANEKREREKMEEINHFGHEEHPLKLIENSEMEKGVHCHRCQEPILGGSVYSCISCPYFLHKTCAELQPTHPFPLTLIAHEGDWICDVCLNHYKSGESAYWCSVCDFDECLNCGVANVALKEKALIKYQEEGQHAFLHHFAHKEHPLMLIVVWETIIGIIGVDIGNNEEKPKGDVVGCDLCEEPLSIGDSAYACTQCRFFLHKSCSQLPKTIHYPSLYHHPLTITMFKTVDSKLLYDCRICRKIIAKGFFYDAYGVGKPGFCCCSNCFLVEFACKAEYDAIKEKATIKLQHEGHPQPTLTLQLRHGAFRCDACKTDEKGLFYQCDSCDFWIHETCAFLPPTIDLPHHHHKHPLFLVHSLPDNFYKFNFYCKFCNQYIRRNEWLYHCANCRYFAHIKCTLNAQQQPSTTRDNLSTSAASDNEISLLHFPMSEAFTDPLKLLHSKILAQDDKETTEINHWSHPAHPLVLNVEDSQGNNMMPDINSGDPIRVCYACVQPLTFPYYSCKEDGCSVFIDLHKYCAHLPPTLQHQLHPDHTLDLVDTWEDEYFYKCTGCFSWGNTFAYKCKMNCKFCLCVNCAFLPITITHESHNHHLTQLIDPKVVCNACNKWYGGISYACKACDFILGMYCAMRSPKSLAHRYCKGHEIPLTYPPVDDHPEDFYCDICEEEMNPNFPLYHCHNHKSRSSFHLGCISRIDYYANVWYGGTITPSYHKHPLTYVRRKKTPKYVCSVCNQDINGFLVVSLQHQHFRVLVLAHAFESTQCRVLLKAHFSNHNLVLAYQTDPAVAHCPCKASAGNPFGSTHLGASAQPASSNSSSVFGQYAGPFVNPSYDSKPRSPEFTSRPTFSHVSVNPCSSSTPTNPFGPKNSTFSTPFHPLYFVQFMVLDSHLLDIDVSGFTPSAQTPPAHNGGFTQPAENLKSISAMPANKDKRGPTRSNMQSCIFTILPLFSNMQENPFSTSRSTEPSVPMTLPFGSILSQTPSLFGERRKIPDFGQPCSGGGWCSVCLSCGGTGINNNNKQSSSPFGQTSSPFGQAISAFGQASPSAGQASLSPFNQSNAFGGNVFSSIPSTQSTSNMGFSQITTSHPVPIQPVQPTQNPDGSLFAAPTGDHGVNIVLGDGFEEFWG